MLTRIPASPAYQSAPRFGSQQPENRKPANLPAAAPKQEIATPKRRVYSTPTPDPATMRSLSKWNNRLMIAGIPVLRNVPLINRVPFVKGHFLLRKIDLPAPDLQMLRKAINPNTAAFIGPNHPEFMADWVLDKHLSDLVAPDMAGWAAASVVKGPLKNFWLRNNVIANDGGKDGEEYSISYALKGKAVLLHPEGTVRWTGNRINPLFPGIANMAVEAAKRSLDGNLNKPVFITPVVWKLVFTQDVSRQLMKEIRRIEKNLGLPKGPEKALAWRFHTLQNNILDRQMKKLGFEEPEALRQAPYFARAEHFEAWLLDDVRSRYSIKEGGTPEQTVHRLLKAINEAKRAVYKAAKAAGQEIDKDSAGQKTFALDLEKVEELKRLGCFTRELYGNGNTLSQEDIAESLKLTRQFLGQGWREELMSYIPKPVGERIAHIRAVEPVNVTELLSQARTQGVSEAALSGKILADMRAAMQERLDRLNAELEPSVAPHRQFNPFWQG